jgi:hypothetical protein
MPLHRKLQKLNRDVDTFIKSLNYDSLCKTKDIYAMIHNNLCKLVSKNFNNISPIENIYIGVRKMEDKIEITGYIKISTIEKLYTFINIEEVYEKKKVIT